MTHPGSGNSTWQDYPSTTTPVNAARLEAIEAGIDSFKWSSRTVNVNTTALANEKLNINASSNSVVISQPASPVTGQRLFVKAAAISASYTVTLNWNIDGDATGVILTATGAGVHITYNGTGWFIDYITPSSSRTGSGSAPASAGSRNGIYNPISNTYSPTGSSLRSLRASIGRSAMNSSSQLVHMCALGDSRTAGSNMSGGTPANNWCSQMRTYLNSQGVPSAGTGLVMASNGNVLDSRIVLAGSWTNTPPYQASAAANATLTFTSDSSGTVAEVYYYTNSGAFTVKIDGGTAVNVPAGSGSAVQTYSVSGLSNTTHSVTVTSTSAACYIVGFCVRGTSGLLVHSVAVGGYTTTQIATTGSNTLQQIVSYINPSILCVMAGVNDPYTNIPVTTTASNFNTILNTNNSNAAKLIVIESPIDSVASQWPPYVSAQYDVADNNNIPLIDVNDKIGSPAAGYASGLLGSDLLHETVAGCNDLARQIANLITS